MAVFPGGSMRPPRPLLVLFDRAVAQGWPVSQVASELALERSGPTGGCCAPRSAGWSTSGPGGSPMHGPLPAEEADPGRVSSSGPRSTARTASWRTAVPTCTGSGCRRRRSASPGVARQALPVVAPAGPQPAATVAGLGAVPAELDLGLHHALSLGRVAATMIEDPAARNWLGHIVSAEEPPLVLTDAREVEDLMSQILGPCRRP